MSKETNMTANEIRRLPNLNLDRLYRHNPHDPIVAATYKARLDACRVPTWTHSSGKEGWYE
jgi:hypothetical protein